MKILVATDGTLDPVRAANTVERMHRPDDTVLVFTALNIPIDFLQGLSLSGVQAAASIAKEAGHPMLSGARAAEKLVPIAAAKERPSQASVMDALATIAAKRTTPIVEALSERGIKADALWRPTDNQTARTIVQTIESRDCDFLIIGSHGHGRFDGLLGSTGTKLVRISPVDMTILRERMA